MGFRKRSETEARKLESIFQRSKEVTHLAIQGKLSTRLFDLEPRIRYVAVNQNGQIVEMEQSPSHPTYNSHDTDRMEELIVNPTVLEITSRRGNVDMDGIRYVVIRYGTQYQLIMPYREGHLSIGLELQDDPIEIARKVTAALNLRA
jgi:hypothetical protein